MGRKYKEDALAGSQNTIFQAKDFSTSLFENSICVAILPLLRLLLSIHIGSYFTIQDNLKPSQFLELYQLPTLNQRVGGFL